MSLPPGDIPDHAWGVDTRADDTLDNGEPGYTKMQEILTKTFGNLPVGLDVSSNPELFTVDAFELCDGKPGFSPLERRVAAALALAFPAWVDSCEEPLTAMQKDGSEDRTRLNAPICQLGQYWYALKHLGSAADRAPFTEANVLAVWERVGLGVALAMGEHRAPTALIHTFGEQAQLAWQIAVGDRPDSVSENSTATVDMAERLGAATAVLLGFPQPLLRVMDSPLPVAMQSEIVNDAAMRALPFRPAFFLPAVPDVQTLLTDKELMADHLYGPIGYYETQTVTLDEGYGPLATIFSPAYGALVAAKVFEYYQRLRRDGTLQATQPFVVYEHGGGDGQLALDFLTYAQAQAQRDSAWAQLWNNLIYTGIEISTMAVQQQRERVAGRFPEKFMIQHGDVITWQPNVKNVGVAIASLLVDSFPVHRMVNIGGQLGVVTPIPMVIFPTAVERTQFLRDVFGDAAPAVAARSTRLQQDYLNDHASLLQAVALTKEDFHQLQNRRAEWRRTDPAREHAMHALFQRQLTFVPAVVPVAMVPDMAEYVARHPEMQKIPEGYSLHVNDDMDRYFDTIAHHYFSHGALFVLDLVNFREGIRPSFMQQRGHVHQKCEEISSDGFGENLVYLPLQGYEVRGTLTKAGAGLVDAGEQNTLWNRIPAGERDGLAQQAYAHFLQLKRPVNFRPATYIQELFAVDSPQYGYLFAEFGQ